jgi:hypothetical protein
MLQAAATDDQAAVRQLLEDGADINEPAPTSLGRGPGTALFVAVLRGHTRMVSLLLENSADTEWNSGKHLNGGTALHCACVQAHVDIVEALIRAGCNVYATDKLLRTGRDLAEIGLAGWGPETGNSFDANPLGGAGAIAATRPLAAYSDVIARIDSVCEQIDMPLPPPPLVADGKGIGAKVYVRIDMYLGTRTHELEKIQRVRDERIRGTVLGRRMSSDTQGDNQCCVRCDDGYTFVANPDDLVVAEPDGGVPFESEPEPEPEPEPERSEPTESEPACKPDDDATTARLARVDAMQGAELEDHQSELLAALTGLGLEQHYETLSAFGLDILSIAQADESDWDDFGVALSDGVVLQRAMAQHLSPGPESEPEPQPETQPETQLELETEASTLALGFQGMGIGATAAKAYAVDLVEEGFDTAAAVASLSIDELRDDVRTITSTRSIRVHLTIETVPRTPLDL